MSSKHDLAAAPGMSAVFDTLGGFARDEDQPIELAAKQSAVAAFSRTGFKAAAVTAIGVRAGSAPALQEVLVRSVEVRFNRPYAVLACAATDQGPQAWRGVPVFSAWITEPQDTVVDDLGSPQPVTVR